VLVGGLREDLSFISLDEEDGVLARVLPYQYLSLCKFHYMMSLLVEYSHLMGAMELAFFSKFRSCCRNRIRIRVSFL